jgi:hypothetical protein
MQKGVLTAFCGVVIYAAMTMGCMDRTPAPVCPVPTKINQTDFQATGFDGVDLLVVVDNSASMEQEQEILATGFFTLINSLVNPMADWRYPPVDNLRVAVVSSDMGLQWGEDGSLEGSPTNISECTGRGDNGVFQRPSGGTIDVESDVIQCEVGGNQCPCEAGGSACPDPSDWACTAGTCTGPATVNCPSSLFGGEDWAENTGGDNLDIAREVACMSNLGTGGCPFEQQLESSVKGLSTYADFMKPEHVLAVLVVSDEEDCSIADSALFSTDEWDYSEGAQMVNVACNWQDGQPDDQYLFPSNRYLGKWAQLKGGRQAAVVFAAIVGVPRVDACQGAGNYLTDCLEEDDMQYALRQVGDQNFFAYACQREEVTKAAPGRRYVQVAQELGEKGYVYSICNADWSEAMAEIAKLIATAVDPPCYGASLAWVPLPPAIQEELDCAGCGTAVCNMVYEYIYPCNNEEGKDACEARLLAEEDPGCPEIFGPQEGELKYEMSEDPPFKMVVPCILPKLPAPFDCDEAEAKYQGDESIFGWYYCENPECVDGEDCCRNSVNLTPMAEGLSTGQTVKIQCRELFNFEDTNCQENTNKVCNDNIDNDGNGVWDCNSDLSGETPHLADRNCCIVDDTTCEVEGASYGADGICRENDMNNPSGACNLQQLHCCLQDFEDGPPPECTAILEELQSS